MSASDPSPQGDTPPPLRPSTQPFSARAIMIAGLVIGLPLLALMILRPSEDGAKGVSNTATEASAPATETQEPASAGLSPNVLPVPSAPSYPKANRVGMLVLNAAVSGLGFADEDQNYEGALSCDPDDAGNPITIWYLVGKFPERRLEGFEDFWTVNGIRVSQSLTLRVDGHVFNADNERILSYENGAVKVKGDLPFSPELHAALQNAHYVELISGDTVLSIAPSAMRSDMIEIADKCAQIAGSGKI
ncbi:hypothetical protein [Sphingobium subterraneum]|uniref:Uncharacterized protein n=1 Tax=Sphingobium subterraneum TaxID=627688 RepID=A0A841J9S8_9SPHN|nr:hypothetical protein [Sphingobium subterraneum]MBB6124901.1 hypothetical protein [Sphingobium subterraneum]